MYKVIVRYYGTCKDRISHLYYDGVGENCRRRSINTVQGLEETSIIQYVHDKYLYDSRAENRTHHKEEAEERYIGLYKIV